MYEAEQTVVVKAQMIYAQLEMLTRSLDGLNSQLLHLGDGIADLEDSTTSDIHERLIRQSGEALLYMRSARDEAFAIAARVGGD